MLPWRLAPSSIAAVVLLFVGLGALRAQSPGRATPVREADAICGKCHAEILKSYLGTSMANASGVAEDHFLSGTYKNPATGVSYTISKAGGKPKLGYSIPGTPPVTGEERLQYFLGSGRIGLTYLYEKNGYWLESPIAYYARISAYTMKPGLEDAPETPALTLNPTCLRCHMSGVQKQVKGSENLYEGLPFQQVGVTCESCHGDTRAHVQTAGHAPVVNPIKLSPEKRDSTCIVCHLEGDTSVEHLGRDAADFTPGEDIRDYVSYYVLSGETTTHRAVSEIEQFNSSRCKRITGASMSCMNCHDPHSSPAPDQKVAFYRSKCLTCHSQPAFAAQHFPSNPDCTGCHMPKTGSENIAHVAWTDHRIRRQPAGSPTALPAQKAVNMPAVVLIPVLPEPDNPRNLGLAYYDLAVKGERSARQRAEQLLTTAAKANPNDVVLPRSLGILAQMSGETARAEDFYKAALKEDPANFIASTNLGALLGAHGDLEGAATLWTPIFKNNQDIPELGQNLAIVKCRLGQKQAAMELLDTVLSYSPGLARVRQLRSAIETGEVSCPVPKPPGQGQMH